MTTPEIKVERGTEVLVSELPECNFCSTLDQRKQPAKYDGQTNMRQWANMCQEHFNEFGIGLGVGRGQRLILIDGGD